MHKKKFLLITINRFRLQQFARKQLYTNLKKPVAFIVVYTGIFIRLLGDKRRGLRLILKGRRVHKVNKVKSILNNIITEGSLNRSEFIDLLDNGTNQMLEFGQERMLILKLPILKEGKILEKGVVIYKFSNTFIWMYLSLDVKLLSKYFRIVLEPSSSGYTTEEVLVWTTLRPEKIIVFSPDDDDFEMLGSLNTNLVPIKLGAADWANPERFYKIENIEKEYDVIYIANFNPVKRVDRYIEAMVNIKRKKRDFRAALVCAGFGEAKNEIKTMIDWASDKAHITFFNGMPQDEINKLFNKSKVNVLLSLKEGANKGLTEGLFSGTPAILLNENVGVKRESINEHTGKIVADKKLEETLLWFSENYKKYQPEKWAINNLSPNVSTKLLEQKLKEIEVAEGRNWTVGLYPKVNQPELNYLNQDDAWLLLERMELLNRFTIGSKEKSAVKFLELLQKKKKVPC